MNCELHSFEGLFELLQVLLGLGFPQVELDEEYIRILSALSADGVEVSKSGELLHLGYGFVAVVYALLVVVHFKICQARIPHRCLVAILRDTEQVLLQSNVILRSFELLIALSLDAHTVLPECNSLSCTFKLL